MKPRLFLLLLFATGLSTGGFEIEEEEYKCESAVAHLAECCDGFQPTSYACYADGCSDVDADISIADADCLRGKTCRELNDEGYCAQPRLGNPYPSQASCDQALDFYGDCCGEAARARFTCNIGLCGLTSGALLPKPVWDCVSGRFFTTNSCNDVKARGLCDSVEHPACAP